MQFHDLVTLTLAEGDLPAVQAPNTPQPVDGVDGTKLITYGMWSACDAYGHPSLTTFTSFEYITVNCCWEWRTKNFALVTYFFELLSAFCIFVHFLFFDLLFDLNVVYILYLPK